MVEKLNKNEQNQGQEDALMLNDKKKSNKWGGTVSFILEIVKTIIISLAIILPIRYFLIQPFLVDGASMQPNFHNRDYLIVNEISYRFTEPKRGEVIVLKNPDNTKQFFIKRIIALPGEFIKIENGNVYIKEVNASEFKIINEKDYLPADLKTFGSPDPIQLKSDEYFVMGDNRGNSRDGRVFGPLKRSLIVGKILFRGFPFKDVRVFDFDNYNFNI
jgi:signal peptidase I